MKLGFLSLCVIAVVSLSGCAGMSRTDRAVMGGIGGGAVGAAVSHSVGGAAAGAGIGAILGAITH